MRRWGTVAAVVLCLAAGCGKGRPVKVSGVLTWEDGKPVDNVTVMFMPESPGGRQASGFTGADGTFDLTTFNAGDGALPGSYKVVVVRAETVSSDQPTGGPNQDPSKAMQEWFNRQKSGKGKASKAPEKTIPAIYTSEKTTPLKWTVESGGPKVELKLKKV